MAAPVYRSFAVGGTAAATSFTCSKPSGVVTGDLLIAFQSVFDATGTVVPAISGGTGGWTALPGISPGWDGFAATLTGWYRVADGSEPSSYTASIVGGASFSGTLAIVATNGAGEVVSGNAVSASDTSADTTAAAPAVAPVGDALLFISNAYHSSVGYTYPGAYTDTTGEVASGGGGNNKQRVCRRENYTGGSTGTVNGTYASSRSDVIIHVAVTVPAAPFVSAPFVAATTTLYAPALVHTGQVDAPFIAASSSVYTATFAGTGTATLLAPFAAAATAVYTPVVSRFTAPFVPATTMVYTPTIRRVGIGAQPVGVSLGLGDATLENAPTWVRIDQ